MASGVEGKKPGGSSPAVRFASVNEEIAPSETLQDLDSHNITADGDAQLKQLSESLQGSHLQERRMSQFAFEPVSLPTSRVCSLSLFSLYSVQRPSNWSKFNNNPRLHCEAL
jgi:hypothetical protein